MCEADVIVLHEYSSGTDEQTAAFTFVRGLLFVYPKKNTSPLTGTPYCKRLIEGRIKTESLTTQETEGKEMPHITIKMYEGRTQQQKEEIVAVFTRELSRIIDREERFITIEFNEIPVDENAPSNLRNAGTGGNGHGS